MLRIFTPTMAQSLAGSSLTIMLTVPFEPPEETVPPPLPPQPARASAIAGRKMKKRKKLSLYYPLFLANSRILLKVMMALHCKSLDDYTIVYPMKDEQELKFVNGFQFTFLMTALKFLLRRQRLLSTVLPWAVSTKMMMTRHIHGTS